MSIPAKLIGWITGGLVDKILDAYRIHKSGKTSEAEFERDVKIAGADAAAKVEQAWAEASTKMVESVQATVRSSPVIQRAYAIVLFIQLFVLVWYQLGAPAYAVITGARWPEPMASIEWAYLLIAAMIGAGPLVLRR